MSRTAKTTPYSDMLERHLRIVEAQKAKLLERLTECDEQRAAHKEGEYYASTRLQESQTEKSQLTRRTIVVEAENAKLRAALETISQGSVDCAESGEYVCLAMEALAACDDSKEKS